MKVKVIHMTIDHVRDEDILEEGAFIKIEVEGHQIEKVIKIEGIQGEEDPLMIEDPHDNRGPPDDGGAPDDGGPPGDGGPPDDGGSPDNGGTPGNGRPPR